MKPVGLIETYSTPYIGKHLCNAHDIQSGLKYDALMPVPFSSALDCLQEGPRKPGAMGSDDDI
jgi:hypothetical protein